MSFRELFAEEEFVVIYNEVETFAHKMLDEYNQKLCAKKVFHNNQKEIFDAVWGNVEFSSGEIYILDSPLLQRLRKIKQLGLAYYVYCGCDYSRFYHTVGVTYLADRMATAINRCEMGIDRERKNYFKATVRLAAIFHDVGHMFLSHVSEHYFSKSPLYPRNEMIDQALNRFERKAGKGISLHELLSCMIVNTEPVVTLLQKVMPEIDGIGRNEANEVEELVEYISCLIAGVPVDREILPYSSIINGPIDADKCDYLSRDSHVTRVPVAVDISRITQKLSVVETEDINTSQLWHEDASTNNNLYELAMKDSAEKALFQLCIARTIMFDSVYYHHKVLTAETEFRNLINQLAHLDMPVFTNFSEILNYTDEDFNIYFFQSLKTDRDDSDCKRIDMIYKQFEQLYARNIAKRVVCLMPEYLEGTQSCKERLFDSILTTIDSSAEQIFIKEITEEYTKVRSAFGMDEKKPRIYIIQAPTNIFGHSKIQVPIDLRNGNKRDFKGYELVSSRETSSSASYLVADEEDRLLVYFALEKILAKKYCIYLKQESISCGKFEQKEINTGQRDLYRKGYYDDAPDLINNSLLYNHLSQNKIKEIVNKFNGYEGPQGYKVTEVQAKRFFKQIMSACADKSKARKTVEGVYCLLQNSLFINREYVAANILGKLKVISSGTEVLHIVPLGSLKDSAKHMAYFFNDIKIDDLLIDTEKRLDEVLQIENVEKIVFFDDGSFSGTQLISIMQEYMGCKERKTDEKHVDELTEEAKGILRQKSIVFFFIAFNKSKEKSLKEDLKQLGLQNISFEYIEDMSHKRLEKQENLLFESDEQREYVKELLSDVGVELMKSTKMISGQYKKNWTAERINKAALGYNNAQQMVFLKSSVPTYTITAFWQSGRYKGFDWEPLFRRTEK